VTHLDYSQDKQDTSFPVFRREPVENAFKSNAAGHPVYDEVEMVEIITPGVHRSGFDGRVTAEHKRRWPVQYAKFQQGLEAVVEGTPLEAWPALSKTQVINYQSRNIKTVEQLAMLSDGQLTELGDRKYRDDALKWLEKAWDGEAEAKLKAERDQIQANFDDLNRRFNELAAAVAAKEAKVAE
jgi:hypothetical protein